MIYIGQDQITMWGPNEWDKNVSVHQFKALFSDGQEVLVNCAHWVGTIPEDCQKTDKYLIPLGRIPDFVRYGVKQLDLRPGINYIHSFRINIGPIYLQNY